MSGGSNFSVALVGRKLPDNENLGLGYLASALGQAGIACGIHVLNSVDDLGRICESVMSRGVSLVGLSLADGGSAFLPLALGNTRVAGAHRAPGTAYTLDLVDRGEHR